MTPYPNQGFKITLLWSTAVPPTESTMSSTMWVCLMKIGKKRCLERAGALDSMKISIIIHTTAWAYVSTLTLSNSISPSNKRSLKNFLRIQ